MTILGNSYLHYSYDILCLLNPASDGFVTYASAGIDPRNRKRSFTQRLGILRDVLQLRQCKRRSVAQAVYASQEFLQLSKGRRGCVLRPLVARETGHDNNQATLMMGRSHNARLVRQIGAIAAPPACAVSRDIEGIGGTRLKSQLPTPRHVLNGQQDAVGGKNKIGAALDENDILGLVNDIGELVFGRGERFVIFDKGRVDAHAPFDLERRVDGLLHVLPVKVGVVTQGIVEIWAVIQDVVYVEARVVLSGLPVDAIPQVAAPILVLNGSIGEPLLPGKQGGLLSSRRIHVVLLDVVSVSAALRSVVQLGPEAVVKGHEVVVLLDKRLGNGLGLDIPVEADAVNHHEALEIVVLGVVGIDKVAGDVRAVVSAIRLTDHVHLVALHAKGIDEVLPEPQELFGQLIFIVDGGISSREANSHGLLDPHNICKMMPAPRVPNWLQGAGAPDEWAVLLEQTEERRAAGLGCVSQSDPVMTKRGDDLFLLFLF